MYLVNFCFSLTAEIQSQKISGKYIFSKFYKKIFSTNRRFFTTETGYYVVIGERRGRFGGLRGLSRRNISGGYRGAVCDCFMGAGVPPFMEALTPFALWGALKVFRYLEFLPQYPSIPSKHQRCAPSNTRNTVTTVTTVTTCYAVTLLRYGR